MRTLDAREFMFCWTPETDQAALVPWPDLGGASDAYEFSALACNADFHRMTFEGRKMQVLCEALHAIVRDRVPADVVHRVLLPLAEYQSALAEDMPR